MRLLKALLVGATLALGSLSVVGLQGCAALGIPSPQSFNERLAVGYSTVTSARNTATSLLGAGKISVSDAENVLEQTDNARAGLDIAREIHAATPDAANARLTAVLTGLRALEVYLKSRGE